MKAIREVLWILAGVLFLILGMLLSPVYAQVLIEPINPLPEPGTIALVCLALGVMLFRHIKRKR